MLKITERERNAWKIFRIILLVSAISKKNSASIFNKHFKRSKEEKNIRHTLLTTLKSLVVEEHLWNKALWRNQTSYQPIPPPLPLPHQSAINVLKRPYFITHKSNVQTSTWASYLKMAEQANALHIYINLERGNEEL